MCIIIVKPAGVNAPTDETLKTCFTANPHGAGIMYNGVDGKVHIIKGFMKQQSFIDTYRDVIAENPDATVVAHCRITTQGGVQQALCHPFPLTNSIDEMRKLKVKCSVGIAHNGIIRLTSDGAKKYNDTMKFIADYLSNICCYKEWYKDSHKIKLINNLACRDYHNKFAVLDGTGHVELIGDFIESDGCFYSNDSFKSYRWSRATTTDVDYCDSDDDFDWNKWFGKYDAATKKAAETKKTQDSNRTYEQLLKDHYYPTIDAYIFDEDDCPYTRKNCLDYCDKCNNDKCKLSNKYYGYRR